MSDTMPKYKVTIGLEIHAELKTKTKMFCASVNNPDEERPNVNICPVCMGHPGTLPTLNREAIAHVLKIGHAVEGKIADFTEWDRKNYFYPDIPKGYQISQYKYPLVSGGQISGIDITRIHLEEDTASSSHDEGDFSLVDFNRAGVPLMELVTEPVIHSAKDAVKFAKELQLLLRYLGAGEANMEKGQMRVEANISVSATDKFGTKTEVKNLNSFRAVERAIDFEIKRQIELLEGGGKVVQETRGWDENKQKTFSQRIKEDSHDYRYFPEPDLPKLKISEIPEFAHEKLLAGIPELPWTRRTRLKAAYDLKDEDAELFTDSKEIGDYFETVAQILKDKKLVKLASNYVVSDYIGILRKSVGEEKIEASVGKVPAKEFAALMSLISLGKLSSRGAKDTLKFMYEEGGTPLAIAEAKGLIQKSDEGELQKVIDLIVTTNPGPVEDFKNGKQAALQFLVGQGMKATKGGANPELLKSLFEKKIG